MTRKCLACDGRKGMTRFDDETFTIEHAGMKKTVDSLSGWRCDACDEVEFDAASAHRYAAAGDELVLRDRARQRHELKRIRRKLGLSQAEAANLTGGGHNAFSRYERGEALPMAAVVNLFKILDKHPSLVTEIEPRAVRATQNTTGNKVPPRKVAALRSRSTAKRASKRSPIHK